MKKINLLFVILIIILNFISCKKERDYYKEGSYNDKTESSQNKIDEPSKDLIEREVMDIVNRIPVEDYKYNTGIFLNKDGVFKNLATTSIDILSRSNIQTIEGIDQQTIQIKITGIMDKYVVGGGLPPTTIYQGRGNFIVNKEFVFKKKNNSWLGYLNDDARDSRTLRFKKKLMR